MAVDLQKTKSYIGLALVYRLAIVIAHLMNSPETAVGSFQNRTISSLP